MLAVSYTNFNRRKTYRNELQLEGMLHYRSDSYSFDEQVIINNLSLSGIQAVFQNNPLLFELLKQEDEKVEFSLTLAFSLQNEDFSLDCFVEWLRIYDVGERNFYVLTGLQFRNKNKEKERLLELLLELNMEKIEPF